MGDLNKKRLIDATFEDLEIFLECFFSSHEIRGNEKKDPQKVRGLKAIADVLQISTRTLSTLRKETKIFDDAIRQKGRIITADVETLLNIKF